MEIKIEDINLDYVNIRDGIDKSHTEELKTSLKQDGLWNPIIVKEKNGKYDLIAGEHRVIAAKKLGWDSIEATIKEIEDKNATFLALKTNLFRLDMKPIEEGKVLVEMKEEFELSNRDLGEKVGKSDFWVRSRINLIKKGHKKVQDAVKSKRINTSSAVEITRVKKSHQPELLKTVEEENISKPEDIKKTKSELTNDTIYTIGYQQKDYDQILEILKENKIKNVIDVRHSTKSTYKPEFNEKVLKKALQRDGINYISRKGFGVPYLIQTPYKKGKIQYKCFEDWYKWYVDEKNDLDKFNEMLKQKEGRSVLMCYERFAKAKGVQKITCHRSILADLLLNLNLKDRKKFTKRVDL